MTQAYKNLMLIQNFILHVTHSSDDVREENFKTSMEFTPEQLYKLADSYIEEDHADGKGNKENNVNL